MVKPKSNSDGFHKQIIEAVLKLQNHEYEKSYKLIVIALSDNPDAPEPHNLLGIWFELNHDHETALRHYRAAYALDPTYKPACKNIERICTHSSYDDQSYDFGNNT